MGTFSFPDHHEYSVSEIDSLVETARKENAILITTSKDSMRLIHSEHLKKQRIPVLYIPIQPVFLSNESEFKQSIVNYINTNM